MRYGCRILFSGMIFLSSVILLNVYGQDSLRIMGRIVNEQGGLKNALVQVTKDSTKISRYYSGESGNFSFLLDYGQNYQIDFKKKGYFTKIIQVDTRLPEEQDAGKYQLVTIDLELIENVNNQSYQKKSLGKVYYDRTTKEFNYESKYSDDITTNIRMAGTDYYPGYRNKKEEEEKLGQMREMDLAMSEADRKRKKLEFIRKINRKKGSLLKQDPEKLEEAMISPDYNDGNVTIPDTSVVEYSHHGMDVTEIVITAGEIYRVYHKVVHNWGAVFYFKNYMAISGDLFRLETGFDRLEFN
jgi:hypothetical protein